MPHIEYSFPPTDTSASISRYDKDTTFPVDLIKSTSYRGAKADEGTLEVWVNSDDWSFCTPFEGVMLEVGGEGLPGTCETTRYRTKIHTILTWEQVRTLHAFLGYLLTQEPDLHLSEEDRKAAAENPD